MRRPRTCLLVWTHLHTVTHAFHVQARPNQARPSSGHCKYTAFQQPCKTRNSPSQRGLLLCQSLQEESRRGMVPTRVSLIANQHHPVQRMPICSQSDINRGSHMSNVMCHHAFRMHVHGAWPRLLIAMKQRELHITHSLAQTRPLQPGPWLTA